MLKRLTILGVLAAFTAIGLLKGQAAPLGPPKQGVAKTDSGQSGRAQADAQYGKQSSPNPITTASKQPPAAACDETCQQGRENLGIQRKLEWFTGVLAAVGVLQVIALIWQTLFVRRTWAEIHLQAALMKTQAEQMGAQTNILENSVAAAQKSADAALAQVEAAKSVQRAQLRIEFAEPELTFDDALGGYPVRFKVILDGESRAYIMQNAVLAYMGRTAREKKSPSTGMHIPRNFTPEMNPLEDYTLIRKISFPPEVDTEPGKPDLVRKQNFTVFVDGYILYRDIFGDVWMLEIDRVWTPNSRHFGEGATGGNWYPFASGHGDTHRKVEYPKPAEPPKPN